MPLEYEIKVPGGDSTIERIPGVRDGTRKCPRRATMMCHDERLLSWLPHCQTARDDTRCLARRVKGYPVQAVEGEQDTG
ncbi:hypothetical protein KSC_044210 [Ktedonobacter sp. SOSP1-52]|nr:hypothetical protein KSC_044210 [Ktedonobacter sp. SOSP1-52]